MAAAATVAAVEMAAEVGVAVVGAEAEAVAAVAMAVLVPRGAAALEVVDKVVAAVMVEGAARARAKPKCGQQRSSKRWSRPPPHEELSGRRVARFRPQALSLVEGQFPRLVYPAW